VNKALRVVKGDRVGVIGLARGTGFEFLDERYNLFKG
jgi:hypothetical protein